MRARGGAVALLLAAGAGLGAAPEGGLALARVTLVEHGVEKADGRGAWRPAEENAAFATGEKLRTGPEAVARVELPWMAVTLSGSSLFTLPDEFVLSAVLEQGRVELASDRREILKLLTPEAEVRGQGRVVVRRLAQATAVSSLAGRFLVTGGGSGVWLEAGRGTLVMSGRAPGAPLDLPRAPAGLSPGSDPVYVLPGQPLTLAWEGARDGYHVQVLPVRGEAVLLDRDVGAPPWRVAIPWAGAFRWRVSARDERGLEGLPSSDGLICVEDRQ